MYNAQSPYPYPYTSKDQQVFQQPLPSTSQSSTPRIKAKPPPSTTTTTPASSSPLNHLLHNYTTSHPLRSPSPLPPSSRIDPKRSQRLPPPLSSSPLLWTIPTWIAFVQFAIAKGLHIIWSLIKHFLVGPARQSWGYRMTFIVSFMRNVADHSSLADIVLVRRLISLHSLIPLPADAVVTPITFVVPRRAQDEVAKGFLREWDVNEPGTRELTGEWVVGTEVWKRLKSERRARTDEERRRKRNIPHSSPLRHSSGDRILPNRQESKFEEDISPADSSPSIDGVPGLLQTTNNGGEKVIYYIHGGAYYIGNAATHRLITIGVSKACNARVFAITYRLAPEHVFPLGLHDVLHGYLRLLAPPLSIAPENIIIAGDSAGGGLSLALCMYLRDEGYQLPAGLVLMSPWVDLTMSCGSWDENADSDVVPIPEADDHLNPVGCYLGPEGIATYLTHPYASPLFGDLHNLPPMLIQSGDSEVLRDEVTLLAHKASLAGVNVTHELYEDMIHVFQMFTWLKPAKAAIDSVGRWVRCTLPKIQEDMASRGEELNAGRGNVQGMEPSVVVEQGKPQAVDADGVAIASDNRHALSRSRSRQNIRGSLGLNLGTDVLEDGPTIDFDSLPRGSGSGSASGSRSGSPTPTNSPSRTPISAVSSNGRSPVDAQDMFSASSSLPNINRPPNARRHTTFALASTSSPSSPRHSPPPSSATLRRRRPTAGSASLHVSPAASTHIPSNPVSPTPSLRRMLRTPSISGLTSPILGSSPISHSQVHPSTRDPNKVRPGRSRAASHSQSHTDIHNLVEGYVEGGAANETVVYGAGGEIKSVGVLGEGED